MSFTILVSPEKIKPHSQKIRKILRFFCFFPIPGYLMA